MKKKLAALIVGGILMAAAPAAVFAAQDTPGTPGDPDCKGQTTAFVAQGAGGLVDARGLGNVAKELGVTVQEIHDAIDAYCAAP